MKKLSILTILFLSIIRAQPGTEVPGNMSFQGFLTDSEGVAYVDGDYNLTFRLIRQIDETTEQTIWEESHSASVTNGVFSVILGSVTPLPLSISSNVQLETQVGDEILSPRQSLTSVPFALKSSRAQQAFQSVLADTAMIALNAPMADTAQFSYHALDANNADSSMYSTYSQHAVHADTAIISMSSVDAIDELNELLDVYNDGTSIYIGNDPSSNTNFDSDDTEANTALGNNALEDVASGAMNTVVGNYSASNLVSGSSNTAIGFASLKGTTEGEGNTAIGHSAGRSNIGSYNVFLGSWAGGSDFFQNVSNKLIIANSNTTTPLIYGDFLDSTITINGSFTANSISGDGSGLTGIISEMSTHSIYADTANYALGIVGGIEVDDVQNATYADTAYYVEQAQNALTANEAISAENSTYADTAIFVQQSESALQQMKRHLRSTPLMLIQHISFRNLKAR